MLLDEKSCPLCGGANHCREKGEQNACWCTTEEFPKGILESVPDESKNKQCICQKCLDTYKGV